MKARAIRNAGHSVKIENEEILITSEISDSDLEELQFVFEGYTIRRA